jgi:hypothetical protein
LQDREAVAEQNRLDRESEERIAQEKDNTAGKKPLTEYQISNSLRNLGKEIKPVEDVIASVEDLDRLVKPFYGKGDIPGLGRIEGQQNLLGKAARIFGPEEGEQISQAKTKLLRAFIKESAGLAQTLSETQGDIESYGLENLADEETFLRVYPEIKRALAADLARIDASYLPEVTAAFRESYGEGRSPLDYKPTYLAEDADPLADKKKRLAELKAKQNAANP